MDFGFRIPGIKIDTESKTGEFMAERSKVSVRPEAVNEMISFMITQGSGFCALDYMPSGKELSCYLADEDHGETVQLSCKISGSARSISMIVPSMWIEEDLNKRFGIRFTNEDDEIYEAETYTDCEKILNTEFLSYEISSEEAVGVSFRWSREDYSKHNFSFLKSRGGFEKSIALAARSCAVEGYHRMEAMIRAVEEAGGVNPRKAALIARAIVGEFFRMRGHFLWMARLMRAVGKKRYIEGFLKELDVIDSCMKELCGTLSMDGWIKVSGVSCFNTESFSEIYKKIGKLHSGTSKNLNSKKLMTAIPDAFSEMSYACAKMSGPIARACGNDRDCRIMEQPNVFSREVYERITQVGGGLRNQAIVRLREIISSCEIIEALMGVYEPDLLNQKFKLAGGAGIGRVEAADGEIFARVEVDIKGKVKHSSITTSMDLRMSAIREMPYSLKIDEVELWELMFGPSCGCSHIIETGISLAPMSPWKIT